MMLMMVSLIKAMSSDQQKLTKAEEWKKPRP